LYDYSETPYYSLSIPELWKKWTWSERFPGHAELRRYFRFVGKTLNAYEDTYFTTIVDGVEHYDGRWHLNLRDSGRASCTYLILSTGSSYKRHYPSFKDMDHYKGHLIHSALYPEEGLDVKGKRVAVIGNGATGVQIVQELAREDCYLTTYIRTPNIALPMHQRPMTVAEQEAAKSFYAAMFTAARNCRSGFPYNPSTQLLSQVTEAEWRAQFQELWDRGGFAFLLSNYRDFLIDRNVNKIFYDWWATHVRARMKNEEKRDIVAPLEQGILFGTKRSSLEQDYYEALDRDNVTVLNLKTLGLERFTEKGIVTSDGVEREYDIVILATGYDSLTGSLTDLNIKDTSGRLLQDKWARATYTYLGLMINGLPNAFLTYSPQAPTSLANGPPIIEIQVDWIVDAIKKMREEGVESVDPKFEAANKWRADIQEMNSKTLFPYTDSW
jgi:cation diffusion facilitator CzcD-associated flavoprotein CzcO